MLRLTKGQQLRGAVVAHINKRLAQMRSSLPRFARLLLILIFVLYYVSPGAAQNDGSELWRDVIAAARTCTDGKRGIERVQCYINASPKKCETRVLDFFASRGDTARRAWALCVRSCVGASFWSRQFGECSRLLY